MSATSFSTSSRSIPELSSFSIEQTRELYKEAALWNAKITRLNDKNLAQLEGALTVVELAYSRRRDLFPLNDQITELCTSIEALQKEGISIPSNLASLLGIWQKSVQVVAKTASPSTAPTLSI